MTMSAKYYRENDRRRVKFRVSCSHSDTLRMNLKWVIHPLLLS